MLIQKFLQRSFSRFTTYSTTIAKTVPLLTSATVQLRLRNMSNIPREDSGFDTEGARQSVWIDRDDLLLPSTQPKYPKLTTDLDTDVLVVGGGIAGLHIAYELLNKGKKVVLVDDGKIGSGETGRTTGHLSVDNEYNEFLSHFGVDKTAQIALSQQSAISTINAIVDKHSISCDFEKLPGYMFQGLPSSSPDFNLDNLNAIFNAANDTKAFDISWVDEAGIKGFHSGKTIRFGDQATFHITKYLKGLAGVVKDLGGEIYEGSKYMSHEDGKEGEGVKIEMGGGQVIQADKLVLATNVPLQKLVMIERCEAYRTYAIALSIPSSSVSTKDKSALYWDTADPYHYIRITPSEKEGYSLLVVGGEDDKVGQHDDYEEKYKKLEEWTRERWTSAEELVYKWSGQVIESADGILYSGRNPGENNVYVHTGDNGAGLTYAAIGGQIISDLITGVDNPLADLYSPSRSHSPSHLGEVLSTIPHIIKENLSDQVYFAKWVSTCAKTVKDIEDLVPGEGIVCRDGLSPIAAYKDQEGNVHKMTAICPHLKAIVGWNSSEKSWDCPVHGSRFTCRGAVVNGPAKIGLAEKE